MTAKQLQDYLDRLCRQFPDLTLAEVLQLKRELEAKGGDLS